MKMSFIENRIRTIRNRKHVTIQFQIFFKPKIIKYRFILLKSHIIFNLIYNLRYPNTSSGVTNSNFFFFDTRYCDI